MNGLKFGITLMVCLGITACSGAKKTLGFEKTIPDEFRVISNQPLSVPPDFHLRPPKDAAAIAKKSKKTSAKQLSDSISHGEGALLKNARTEDANANIRQQLEREQQEQLVIKQEETWLDTLLGKDSAAAEDPVVDSMKERKRIQENEKEGKTVVDGETPVIEQEKSKNILKRILNW